jgi:hypothetical protein
VLEHFFVGCYAYAKSAVGLGEFQVCVTVDENRVKIGQIKSPGYNWAFAGESFSVFAIADVHVPGAADEGECAQGA